MGQVLHGSATTTEAVRRVGRFLGDPGLDLVKLVVHRLALHAKRLGSRDELHGSGFEAHHFGIGHVLDSCEAYQAMPGIGPGAGG